MHFTKKIIAASAAAIAIAGMTSVPAHAAEKVNYLLPAPGFLPAFAPWQLAKYKGFYADEGLDVTFQRAKGGVDVAKQVGVGNAPIGGGIGDTSLLVRPNGIPVRSVAIMGGGSLVQLVARADRNINKVEDLKGKTITVMSYQDTTFFAAQGILASRGLTRNDANIQAAGPQGVWKLFVQGKADAMMGVPDWIGIARGAKVKMKIFNAMDYFPSMAQAILASDEMIKTNPKLIQGLVRATLNGAEDDHGRSGSRRRRVCQSCAALESQSDDRHVQALQRVHLLGTESPWRNGRSASCEAAGFLFEIRLHQEEVQCQRPLHEPVR